MSRELIPFHKYHGLGNDFVVVPEGAFPPTRRSVATLCDRHEGVGADGVIFYRVGGEGAGWDAQMIIYNRDGSRPEMCGNGIRCLARHLVEVERLREELTILSDAGPRRCEVAPGQETGPWDVTVDMGQAVYTRGSGKLEYGGRRFEWSSVNMGNPHAVIFAEATEAEIDAIGAFLNADHPQFPEGVNVEFTRAIGPQHLEAIVYERGVGRTRACGTGACAAAVAGWHEGLNVPNREVRVDLPGGPLTIVREEGERIWMTGPAQAVFRGEWLQTTPK